VRGIVGEIAEAWAWVRHAIEGDVGEQSHHAGASVDLINGSGSALQVEPELPLHPAGAGAALFPAFRHAVVSTVDDVETEDRSGGGIDKDVVNWPIGFISSPK
jgi:hypothetical protein